MWFSEIWYVHVRSALQIHVCNMCGGDGDNSDEFETSHSAHTHTTHTHTRVQTCRHVCCSLPASTRSWWQVWRAHANLYLYTFPAGLGLGLGCGEGCTHRQGVRELFGFELIANGIEMEICGINLYASKRWQWIHGSHLKLVFSRATETNDLGRGFSTLEYGVEFVLLLILFEKLQ